MTNKMRCLFLAVCSTFSPIFLIIIVICARRSHLVYVPADVNVKIFNILYCIILGGSVAYW